MVLVPIEFYRYSKKGGIISYWAKVGQFQGGKGLNWTLENEQGFDNQTRVRREDQATGKGRDKVGMQVATKTQEAPTYKK